jgi:hypothetical protein
MTEVLRTVTPQIRFPSPLARVIHWESSKLSAGIRSMVSALRGVTHAPHLAPFPTVYRT